MLTAGKLNERIHVRRAVEVEKPEGSTKKEWAEIHTAYCHVTEKDASIDLIASQDNIGQVVMFTLRYNPEVFYQIGDRITWRSRDFKIHSLKVDTKRISTVIVGKAHNETTQM
ncbi:head-tail adaptor protein [Sphingobacterium sp. UT-1RO-CII-1]|uniref:phage head completion protein n=1 Tax=Sphingobacterium sp. UT-1RO-CII-1 TaxID=2995225 RepID=UPI00227C17D8|nr:head-tail adaptor protein [Sphingobacterium sp. UT-1RO-CII-1]MCY4781706.1 head-tail adaptor protein [Sphingobacterium sp. UT-1RO-CII-1]